MTPARESRAGLIVLAISGALALNYPLLSLFDRDASVFGIPLPFMHLFVVWTLLIGGIAILIERNGDNGAKKGLNGGDDTPVSERRPRTDD